MSAPGTIRAVLAGAVAGSLFFPFLNGLLLFAVMIGEVAK